MIRRDLQFCILHFAFCISETRWFNLPMDIRVGDVLTMKKKHPCGAERWLVLRSGMDFRLRCLGCGREVMIPRAKAEKGIKSVERPSTM